MLGIERNLDGGLLFCAYASGHIAARLMFALDAAACLKLATWILSETRPAEPRTRQVTIIF